MLEIPLNGKLNKTTKIDEEDFELVNKYNWNLWSSKKCPGHFYAIAHIWINGKRTTLKLHRLLKPETYKVDHFDGDGLNNQKHNLRNSDKFQNARNRKLNKDNKIGYKGVKLENKNKFVARIGTGGNIRLGLFNTPEEAAKAYDIAALRMYGEFARTNFDREKYNTKEYAISN